MDGDCLPILHLLPQLRRKVKNLCTRSLPAELDSVYSPARPWVYRDGSVLIFDFDDTLFPNFVMENQFNLNEKAPLRAQLKRMYGTETKVNTMERQYSHFLKSVDELLQESYSFGSVVIVTLGEQKRVRNILDHLWPEFAQSLDKCTFVFAREHMSKAQLQRASNLGRVSSELEKLGSNASEAEVDAFLDNWAELWTGVKKDAILSILRERGDKNWLNVLSIGDSVFERDATILACNEYSKGRAEDGNGATLRIKTLKFLETPNLATLGLQLRFLRLWMPCVVCLDCHRNLEFDNKLQLNEHLNSGDKVPFLGGRIPPKFLPGIGWGIEKHETISMLPWSTEDDEEEPVIGA